MSSKSLGTLTLDLVARVGGYVAGLDKAERESAKFRKKVKKELEDVGKALAGMGLAAVAATALLVRSSINTMDALSKQSQAYGVAIEDLSAYAHAAELSDVSSEQLAAGLGRLARAIESDNDALKKLGISSRDASGELRSVSNVLEDVAERFAGIEDGTAKTALAQDLLGKSGARMIPFLNSGREGLAAMREEAERLGLVLDEKTAQQAEEFNDNLTRMKSAVQGTGLELARGLLPQLVEFTNTIQDPATQQGLRLLVKGMADFVIEAVKLVGAIPTVTRFLAESLAATVNGPAIGDFVRISEQIADLDKVLDGTASTSLRTKIGLQQMFRGDWGRDDVIARRAELLEKLQATMDGINANTPSAPAAVQPGQSGGAPILSDEELSDQEKLNQTIEDRLAKYREQVLLHGKTTELSRLQAEIENGLLTVTEEQRADLEAWAQAADSLGWIDRVDAARKSGEQIEADLKKQIALFGEVTDAARLRYELEQEALSLMDPELQARIVMLAEELDALKAVAEEEKKAQDEREKQAKQVEELGLQAARNIQTHFSDFLFDPFDGGLKGMARGFADTLRRMAAEAASNQILKGLFGGLAGSGNSILAAIGGSFAGMKDGGGHVGAGQWAIAGEIGPEIIRGPATVISRTETSRMLGGDVQINVINNAPATVRQGPVRFDGGRRQIDLIVDAVKTAVGDGQLDDVLAGSFGITRAGGSL